ncbi:hypothetical protein AVEN_43450-1 [Araneus ventricosus]|uniref:STPR domain-containing protein n=1 Tax=Araneus ventricosus TaxID=182803 RepID=A0A4Y2JL26_ARAVE|nr:hypothetical protein AVEN_43450-1 [Araneus ventricosus]
MAENNGRHNLDYLCYVGQKRGAEETEEKINSRLSDMAQRGHERKAEETEGQRNSRLSAMVQHARERRLNVIEGQNHHQIYGNIPLFKIARATPAMQLGLLQKDIDYLCF